VYNLDVDDSGVSSYEVEYWIVPIDPRERGLWRRRAESATYAASTIDGSAYGADVPLYITIDTENLWPGDFELRVEVTDNRTQFTADRRAVFSLIEAE
jgi:hypothetical protein